MSLFSRMMPPAARILFVFAVVIFVLVIIAANSSVIVERDDKLDTVSNLIFAVSNGLQAAFWPFFGAAVIWRLDRLSGWGKAAE